MKGLYLNVDGAVEWVRSFAAIISAPSHVSTLCTRSGQHVVVDCHPENWPEGSTYADEESNVFGAGAGYLIYRGVLGGLGRFIKDFANALDDDGRGEVCAAIEAGSFLLFLEIRGVRYLVSDPFGLSPHYQTISDGRLRISPIPTLLANGSPPSELHRSIIESKRHIFGNLTAWPSVERIEVGAIVRDGEAYYYFDYLLSQGDVDQIHQRMIQTLNCFSDRKRILPLSGGLDSRYLLSLGKVDFGYTYGPRDSGDRPVARKFAEGIGDYHEFSLLDLEYPVSLQHACEKMFDGLIRRPLCELVSVYRMLHQRWGGGHVFMDGYLADTLQRGTYFNVGSVAGILYRLFPEQLFRNLTPEQLLIERYRSLNLEERDLLIRTYRTHTARFDCDHWKRFYLFEALYARGARFIVHGGSVLANQFFTSVQPFFFFDVFRAFLSVDVKKLADYSLLPVIWKGLPRHIREVRAMDGYCPLWPSTLSRFVHTGSRLMAKIPGLGYSASYKEELPRIRWV